eukprot:5560783-Alexandrium_andersonii.AAC.1
MQPRAQSCGAIDAEIIHQPSEESTFKRPQAAVQQISAVSHASSLERLLPLGAPSKSPSSACAGDALQEGLGGEI